MPCIPLVPFISFHDFVFLRLPIGALAFAISFTGGLSRIISPKWILLGAQGLLVIATILLHFADGPDKYFQFVLPAFILGTSGCMFTYTHTKYVSWTLGVVSIFTSLVASLSSALLQLRWRVPLELFSTGPSNLVLQLV